ITPGAPLVTIVDIRTVYAKIGAPERAVNKIALNSPVDVRVDSIGLTRKGRVDSVGPTPDPRTRAYPVTIALDNPSEDVKPGMFAHILLSLGKKENTLVVPRDSVVERVGRQVVYVVKPGDPARVEERVVTLGLENGQLVEVLGGVSQGEQVVTNGQHLLVDGALVRVKAAAEKGAGEGGGKP
ncbi:MAG: efflux RND transporter periplasmic adaptor subunit, partial [Bacillota bacterium]